MIENGITLYSLNNIVWFGATNDLFIQVIK